jgi:hypothetical protein
VKHIGRRQWQKESGYHRQARVENAFFRHKSIIGGGFVRDIRGRRKPKPRSRATS